MSLHKPEVLLFGHSYHARDCARLSSEAHDDLARDVYGILGLPVDASDRASVVQKVLAATTCNQPFLLSTPNVNFVAESQRDGRFRESLLSSDLCCADGMPIVWIARLLGVPIKERVSGSDLFEMLKTDGSSARPLKVFLFGGGEGVGGQLCKILNARPSGLMCVGWLNPGFVTVEEMSDRRIIDQINASGADLLAVFLSARKAQFWLQQNHDRLRIPVRGQFGATINYQTGTVRRAPQILQNLGLEWLWRIKEEPYLWRRYAQDGLFLFWALLTSVMPHVIRMAGHRMLRSDRDKGLSIESRELRDPTVMTLKGYASDASADYAIVQFRTAIARGSPICVDLSHTSGIDPRFFGLLLMVRKQLVARAQSLTFMGVTKRTRRLFRRNGFEHLLDVENAAQPRENCKRYSDLPDRSQGTTQ